MKRNLLKAIGISFLIFVVLSWIIPVGTFDGSKLTTNGTDPVGLFDLVGVPVSTLLTFALYIVVFAAIGGFYGVMEKTGALSAWVDGIKAKFNGKEKGFLIFTIIFFVVLSSLTGLTLPLFVLVPLFAMVLFAMNYDKITAMVSTVGALLLGSVCSTYGFNVSGYTKNLLSLDMSNQIVTKVILLVVLTAALIFFVLKFGVKAEKKTAKKVVAEPKKEVKAEPKKVAKPAAKKAVKTETKKTTAKKPAAKKAASKTTTTKKTTTTNPKSLAVTKDVKKVNTKKGINTLPLIIIFVLLMLVTLVGLYNWYYAFEIELFNDIHTAIMGVKIGDYPIFENLLSGISQIGYWGNSEFVMLLVIASALIAWVYKLKFNEFVEGFIAGVRKMLPTAIYAALASVILTVLYQASYAGTGTLVDTLFAKTFGLTDGFNVLVTGVASLFGSFFYNDLYYLLAGMNVYLTGFDADALSVAGLLVQSVYSVGMFIFPTSVLLIAGLSYFDVKFKDWFKFIWKFALVAFILILLVCCILTVL